MGPGPCQRSCHKTTNARVHDFSSCISPFLSLLVPRAICDLSVYDWIICRMCTIPWHFSILRLKLPLLLRILPLCDVQCKDVLWSFWVNLTGTSVKCRSLVWRELKSHFGVNSEEQKRCLHILRGSLDQRRRMQTKSARAKKDNNAFQLKSNATTPS